MKSLKIATGAVFILLVILIALFLPVQAQAVDADAAAVAQVVRNFHEALATGDSNSVKQLLAPDVVILESGGLETREEYLSHHLTGDIQFAQAVTTRRNPHQITVSGDVAWASSTTETQGTFRNRPVNTVGAELMVLSKTAKTHTWIIRAIHWSSRENN